MTPAAPPATATSRTLTVDGDPLEVELTAAAHQILLSFDGQQGDRLALLFANISATPASPDDPYVIDVIVSQPNDATLAQRPLVEDSVTPSGKAVALGALPAPGRYIVGLNLGRAPSARASVKLVTGDTGR